MQADYLRRHRVLESRDLDALRECAVRQGVPLDLSLNGPGDGFDARISAAPLDELALLHVSYGAVRTSVRVRDELQDALLFCLLTSGAGRFEQPGSGGEMSCDRAAVRDMRRPLQAQQDGFGCFALQVPLARLRSQAEALYGPAVHCREPRFDATVDLRRPAGRQLRNTVHLLARQLEDADGLGSPLVAAAWEDLLLATLLETLPNDWAAAGRPRPRALPYHVKRARDHIHAHARRKLTLADLAAAAGCSYRTLQAAFAEATGLSPMAYLRAVRMQAVHEALAAAGPGTSVAAIARDWGFAHPGRFAAEYRRRYGRSPAETLRAGS